MDKENEKIKEFFDENISTSQELMERLTNLKSFWKKILVRQLGGSKFCDK